MSDTPAAPEHFIDQRLRECMHESKCEKTRKEMQRLLKKPGQLIGLKKIVISRFLIEERE